jgi:hypothetical protein
MVPPIAGKFDRPLGACKIASFGAADPAADVAAVDGTS